MLFFTLFTSNLDHSPLDWDNNCQMYQMYPPLLFRVIPTFLGWLAVYALLFSFVSFFSNLFPDSSGVIVFCSTALQWAWLFICYLWASSDAASFNLNDWKGNKSFCHGGAGHQSRYLSHAKRALYHLSYAPLNMLQMCVKFFFYSKKQMRSIINCQNEHCQIFICCPTAFYGWQSNPGK